MSQNSVFLPTTSASSHIGSVLSISTSERRLAELPQELSARRERQLELLRKPVSQRDEADLFEIQEYQNYWQNMLEEQRQWMKLRTDASSNTVETSETTESSGWLSALLSVFHKPGSASETVTEATSAANGLPLQVELDSSLHLEDRSSDITRDSPTTSVIAFSSSSTIQEHNEKLFLESDSFSAAETGGNIALDVFCFLSAVLFITVLVAAGAIGKKKDADAPAAEPAAGATYV
ncbi:hypothetical protein HDU79_005128 [Rhizoclosmatium sp. JEL0117]|nr:hypothetical protein HDU79_005128 [Rhizoclosmatium sp. JEL0117]